MQRSPVFRVICRLPSAVTAKLPEILESVRMLSRSIKSCSPALMPPLAATVMAPAT